MSSEDARKEEVSQEDAGWQYKPADGPAVPSNPHADESGVADAPTRGSVEWTASEFIAHEKGFGWYVALTLGAALAAVCIYMATKDVFAVAVAVIMVAILAISGSHKPRVVTYKVDAAGITVGSKFYPFSAYKSFSMPDEGPFTTIVLVPLKHLSFPVGAYLSPDTQDEVLEIISRHLPLERDQPSAVDRLMRQLRF